MVGGLGDGSHGLHARKSRAALDQARAGEAEASRTRADGEERQRGRFALVDAGASGTDNRRKPCLPGSPAKVPALALIIERSALPHLEGIEFRVEVGRRKLYLRERFAVGGAGHHECAH
jgi:hypothetical protein